MNMNISRRHGVLHSREYKKRKKKKKIIHAQFDMNEKKFCKTLTCRYGKYSFEFCVFYVVTSISRRNIA